MFLLQASLYYIGKHLQVEMLVICPSVSEFPASSIVPDQSVCSINFTKCVKQ